MLHADRQRLRLGALVLFVAIVIVAPGRVHAQARVEFLHAFTGHSNPAEPTSLIQATDGNFYGTTERGGTPGHGTVFRMTPGGDLVVIHEFDGSQGAAPGSLLQANDGNLYGTAADVIFTMTLEGTWFRTFPVAATMLVQGRDGNLYGTAPGSFVDRGGIFRMTLGGVVTVLHSFAGGAGGRHPFFLMQAADGHFYGLTRGGPNAWATLFRMTANGTLTTLNTFGYNGDDYWPRGLTQAADGTFYLAVVDAGPRTGSIYKFAPGFGLTTLHGFGHGDDGSFPLSLAQGADGAIYGTTGGGGALGRGTLFRVTSDGAFSVLHAFEEQGCCQSTLFQAVGGTMYGTTPGSLGDNSGTVYKVGVDGTYSLVRRFTAGPGGANPTGPLFSSNDGHLYGTTAFGGDFDRGTAFRIAPSGAMTILHTFAGGPDGAYPIGDLVQGGDGNFYGSTTGTLYGPSRVFRMSPSGSVTTLHEFGAQQERVRSLVIGMDGTLFGTTELSVFSLTLDGAFSELAVFDWNLDGELSRVVQASNGRLYGMTTGRSSRPATIFTMGPDGSGLRVIATLPPQVAYDGPYYLGGLIQALDGDLYGTIPVGLGASGGTALKVSLAGAVTALHNFTEQESPPFSFVQGVDANFYGVSYQSVVRMDLAGNTTTLHDFGSLSPQGLVQGRDGMLYGTTFYGGPRGYDGTVFRLNPLTPLRPALVTASAAGMTGVTLRWSPVAGATSYTIRRIVAGGPSVVIASGVTGLSFTDTTTSLAAGASYVVVAVNLAGESLASTAVSASRTPTITTARDYDGDGKADVTVYRGSNAEWLTFRSTHRRPASVQWGAPALMDRPVAADYDGDGQADIAVYRQTSGDWFILRSATNAFERFSWGAPSLGDIPIPGDYDGDGSADLAVFRGTTGEWLIRQSSSTSLLRLQWGAPSFGDLPVPADYDGDGQTDVAVYRTTTGEWFVRRSSDSSLLSASWGAPALSDVPVPADYDGDGRVDIAIYRGMTGGWFVSFAAGGTSQFAWGSPALADVPVPADYDGDGLADPAVFRASTGEWFIRQSSDLELVQLHWGAPQLGDSVNAY